MVQALRIGAVLVASLVVITQGHQRWPGCDDHSEVSECRFEVADDCTDDEVLALQHGCFICVDPTTCMISVQSETHEETDQGTQDAQQADVQADAQQVEPPTSPVQASYNENADTSPAQTDDIVPNNESNQFEPAPTPEEEIVSVDAESQPEVESSPESTPEVQEDYQPQQEVNGENTLKLEHSDEVNPNNAQEAVPNIQLMPEPEHTLSDIHQFRVQDEPQAVAAPTMKNLSDISDWYFAIPACLALVSIGIAIRARITDNTHEFERLHDDEEEINPFCEGQQECDLEFAGQGDSDENGEHMTIPPPSISAC